MDKEIEAYRQTELASVEIRNVSNREIREIVAEQCKKNVPENTYAECVKKCPKAAK